MHRNLVCFLHSVLVCFQQLSPLIFLLSFLHALSALIIFYIFEKILFNSQLL